MVTMSCVPATEAVSICGVRAIQGRQLDVAEKMKQTFREAVDEGCAKSSQMQSDHLMNEDEEDEGTV